MGKSNVDEALDALSAIEQRLDLMKQELHDGEIHRALLELESIRFIGDQILESLSEHDHRRLHGPIPKRRVDGAALHRAISTILRRSKRPMALKEIMQKLQARGVEIPGQGRPANIIAHLTRMENVERVDYGKYQFKRKQGET